MIDELELVRRARPPAAQPEERVRARARDALDDLMAGRTRSVRRRRLSWMPGLGALIPAISVLVVVAVVVVFLGLRAHGPSGTGTHGKQVSLVFQARNEPGHAVTAGSLSRAAAQVRNRLAGVRGADVTASATGLVVDVPSRTGLTARQIKDRVQLTTPLYLYDWESNVLTPQGAVDSSALARTRSSESLLVSQGSSHAQPGAPGAGSLGLYAAVRLAARQAPAPSASNSRPGPEYFMFSRAGTATCVAADGGDHTAASHRSYCYLAGPAPSVRALDRSLPAGVRSGEKGVQMLVVPRGWVILQAAQNRFSQRPTWSDPTAQYFVLRDRVSLFPGDVAGARPSHDQAGSPDVALRFTHGGGPAFARLTDDVAKRGQLLGGLGQRLFQHFAFVLGDRLVSVPYFDYLANPYGIPAAAGADIQGSFTASSARQVAAEITPLPVALTLASVRGHTPR